MEKDLKTKNFYFQMGVKKYFIIWLIFLVLSIQCIQFIQAQTNPIITRQPVYKQNEATTISFPCTADGNYCSINATCRTTIIDPDGEVLINNYNMSRNNAVFEINLTSNQTSTLGEYEFNVVCSDNGNSVSRFLNFNITPNGEMPTTASGILYIGLLVLLLVIFGFLIYGFLSSKTVLVKFFLFHLGYLTLLSIFFIAWNMSANYFMSVTFITAFFRITWFVSMIAYFPLILMSFIYVGYLMVQIKEINNMIERGVPEDEALARKMKRKWN